MTLTTAQDVESRIQALIGSGDFPSVAEVVRSAVLALERERAEVTAIQEGFADVEAGRVRPLAEVDAEIREQFGFAPRK